MSKYRPQTELNHAEAVRVQLREHRYDQIHRNWLTPAVLLAAADHGERIIHSLLYHNQSGIIPQEAWTKEVALAYTEGKPTPLQTLVTQRQYHLLKDIPFQACDFNAPLREFLLAHLTELPMALLCLLEADVVHLRNAYRERTNQLHEIATTIACHRILTAEGMVTKNQTEKD